MYYFVIYIDNPRLWSCWITFWRHQLTKEEKKSREKQEKSQTRHDKLRQNIIKVSIKKNWRQFGQVQRINNMKEKQGHPPEVFRKKRCSAVHLQLAGKFLIACSLCWELLTFSMISSRAGWEILTFLLAFQAEQKELKDDDWKWALSPLPQWWQSGNHWLKWSRLRKKNDFSCARDFARLSVIVSECILYLPHLHVS